MRPSEVLDAQVDLIERLGEPTFRGQITNMVSSALGGMDEAYHDLRMATNAREKARAREEIRHWEQQYASAPDLLLRHLKASYAYRVSHDMSLMVEHAASMIDDTDQFLPALAPTGCGIARFDSPLRYTDIQGKIMLVHWMVWGPAAGRMRQTNETIDGGTAVWMFNDTWSQPDEVQQEIIADAAHEEDGIKAEFLRRMGRWATIGVTVLFPGQRFGPATAMPPESQAARLLAEGREPMPGTNPNRFIQALWMLLNQTITKVEREEAERPARRRAKRMGLPSEVTVVRLRREEGAYEPTETEVEWQHRWIVRQHWRWQPYGSRRADHAHVYGPIEVESGTLVQRCVHEGCENHLTRIIINPYVKGPEGAPLKQSEKVYSLDR